MLKASVGTRKVIMGVWFSVLDLIAFLNGLPGTDFQVIMLAVIAAFFSANAYENKVKPGAPEEESQPESEKQKVVVELKKS